MLQRIYQNYELLPVTKKCKDLLRRLSVCLRYVLFICEIRPLTGRRTSALMKTRKMTLGL